MCLKKPDIIVVNLKFKEVFIMGQPRQFRAGQKAPNNGIYVEIGETGSMVQKPQSIRLEVGERFPENSNHNRVWTYKSKFK